MNFDFLNNLSGVFVFITVTLAFSILFEPRYKLKTYLCSFIPFIAVIVPLNLYAIFHYGFAEYGKVTVILATIPSFIYFFIVSKSRDARFVFTFCLIDTSTILFAIISGMIDLALGANGIFNLIMRIGCSPIILYLLYRFGRNNYLKLMHSVKKGWWIFTGITVIAYALLIIVSSYPISLRERPEDIPAVILICILLPLMYFNIFYVLFVQQRIHDLGSIQHGFDVQTNMMKQRANEIKVEEEKVRIERHDLRHKLKVIEEFASKGENDNILKYLGIIRNQTEENTIVKYCQNPVLDAILSAYFKQASELQIKLDLHLRIDDSIDIPYSEIATVIANSLENAINANKKIPPEKRYISMTSISHPTFMFEIKNPTVNKVKFDKDGLPVSYEDGHGLGSKSVFAFCKKYDASYVYENKDNCFRLMVSL